ncbi:MAG: hypothetical protein JRD68_10450 [Deltaproteobacteria bacterium]|nr:hypothetical protein [Deltaproteobacteria bacterium]
MNKASSDSRRWIVLGAIILLLGVPLCLMLKSGWHQDSGVARRGPVPVGG